jgi:hypothetical protein
MRKLTIDLGDERLYRALRIQSAMRSRPMREIVVEALRMWMADQGVQITEDQLETQAAAVLAEGVFAQDWVDPRDAAYDAL